MEEKKTKFNVEKFIENLNTKWGDKPCPMCGKNNWTVADKLFEIRDFHGGPIVFGGNGSIQPIIPVTCVNCGNTIIVNAIVSGAIDKTNVEQ